MIPMVDLAYQHKQIQKSIEEAFKNILERNSYVLGPEVEEFEKAFAAFTKSLFCVGAASGTTALELIVKSLDLKPNDEVIVPVNTFYATASSVAYLGFKPVFVDCDDYYLIDVNKVEEKLTSKTKAIIGVHLYGQMADMKVIRALGEDCDIPTIEDAAQAHGATQYGASIGVGSLCAAYSFFPGKNLGCFGDGGAITTYNEDVYEKLKRMRWFGCKEKNVHEIVGTNSKLDTLQAAVLLKKLNLLRTWNRERQILAANYDRAFFTNKDIKIPQIAPGNDHVYHLYVIRVKNRDRLIEDNKNKIAFGVHYPTPLHLTEAFKYLGYKEGDFPRAEQFAKEIVSLPIHPGLSKENQDIIIEAVLKHVHTP